MGRRDRQKPPATGELRRDLLLIVGLTAIVWIVYWPAREFDFVRYDDHLYILENPYVLQGLTVENFQRAWTTPMVANWQPMMILSLMLDVSLFGVNAPGFHIVNIVFHTVNSVLLYLLLKRMTGATWESACVAALFAVHPLHVESVAWISERKDVLFTFFGLLSIFAYCRYVRSGGWVAYGSSLGLFFLSLASKPMLVTLPFLLLLLDFWPLTRTRWNRNDSSDPPQAPPDDAGKKAAAGVKSKIAEPCAPATWLKLLLEKLPFLVVTMAFSAIAYATQRTGGGVISFERISLPVRIANAILAYGLYLWKTVWPADLSVMYPHPEESISLVAVGISFLLLAAATVLTLVTLRRRPYLLAGWLWYLGTLVPVIGLIQIGRQHMADRYMYFPQIGFFIAIVWLAASLLPNRAKPPAWVWGAVAVPIAACMIVSRFQVETWRNSLTLFTHAIDVIDKNYKTTTIGPKLSTIDECRANFRYMIGWHLEREQHLDEAVREYEMALTIDPKLPGAHADLGALLHSQNRVQDAIAHYEAALAADPSLANTQANLGIALCSTGRLPEGIERLQKAVELDPQLVNAHINLGNALEIRGQNDAALEHYQKAVRIAPNHPMARLKLGERLLAEGRIDEADRELRAAIRLSPNLAPAYSLLGAISLRRGQQHQATEFFNRALQLDPRDVKSRQELQRMRRP